MKEYYYSDGIEKHGPFTLKELQNHKIESDTLIWTEGMEDWKPAKDLPQISLLFDLSVSPPPAIIPPPSRSNLDFLDDDFDDDRPMPKTYLVEAILATFFCCLPFGVAAIVNAAKVETAYHNEGYRAAKRASENAWKWTKVSFWVQIGFLGLYLMVVILGIIFGGM